MVNQNNVLRLYFRDGKRYWRTECLVDHRRLMERWRLEFLGDTTVDTTIKGKEQKLWAEEWSISPR